MPIKLRYCVPNFNEMENHYEIPSSRFSKPKISLPGEEDVMELMLQNGQVVVQKSSKKSSLIGGRGEPVIPADKTAVKEIRPNTDEQQQLFIQEDEMASWLQYPFDDCLDRDMYTDLLYSAPPLPSITIAAPPIPQTPEISPRAQNFVHFSRLPIRSRIEPIPQPSGTKASELTVVESNVTPAVRLESRVSQTVADSMTQLNVETGTSSAAGELARKRTTTEADDTECQSQDIEFEAVEAKKHRPGSSSTKRSRAAEVHNLSERRRRDRINEKMKALQDLIPRCNKSDKASMLDEAIEYLKSLQMQVQMMSMGYGIMPMMYPGMHQYMPAMGMGMNRPMVPYPSIMASSAIPNPAAGPRFLAFHMPPVGLPDPSRNHAFNQSDPINKNQQRMTNIFDPYQQFHGLHQSQIPLPNNQVIVEPGAKNRRTSKNIGNPKHQQTG